MSRISYNCSLDVSRALYSYYLKFCSDIKIWEPGNTQVVDAFREELSRDDISADKYTGILIAPSEHDLWVIVNKLKLSKEAENNLFYARDVDDLAYRLKQVKENQEWLEQKEKEAVEHEWNCGTCVWCINGDHHKLICHITKKEVNETDETCMNYTYEDW